MNSFPSAFLDEILRVHHQEDCVHVVGSLVPTVVDEPGSNIKICYCMLGSTKAGSVRFKTALHLAQKFSRLMEPFRVENYEDIKLGRYRVLSDVITDIHRPRRGPDVFVRKIFDDLKGSVIENWLGGVWDEMDEFLTKALLWEQTPGHRQFMIDRISSSRPGDDALKFGVVSPWDAQFDEKHARIFAVARSEFTTLIQAPLKVFNKHFTRARSLVSCEEVDPSLLELAIGLYKTGGSYEDDFHLAYQTASAL